jgi:Ca2+-binding RTX toxin-like protein
MMPNRVRSSNGLRRLVTFAALAAPGLVAAAIINGTADPDTLEGTPQADMIDGKGDRDTMMGLAGDDVYVVSQSDDEIIEGAGEGTDTVRSPVSFALPIFVENLVLSGSAPVRATGNTLSNRLTGNAANNTLDGRTGTDTMIGRAGDDTYVVDSSSDVVKEAAASGTDLVVSSAVYTLPANVENLTLSGTATINGVGNDAANVLRGNAGNNVLQGLDGNDVLSGKAGNDQLIGGLGNDQLVGGPGADSFRFSTAPNATTNLDVITDFNPPEDFIRLDGAVFTAFAVTGTIGIGAFQTGAAALDSSDRILYDPATGAVRYDADGTGATAAVRFASLKAGLAITNADFFVQGPAAGTPVNFATQIQPIFNNNCTRCHSGSGAPRGLRLDSANSYANLVNVASVEVPSLKRIKPGDDSNSYLVQKIEGTAAVGGRMPLNSTPLSATNIALIRRWVVEGATNSGSSTTSPPIDPGY